MRNQIVILTEALESTGIGHLNRCANLYAAASELGLYCTLLVETDEKLLAMVEARGGQPCNWRSERMDIGRPAVVVIDSYRASFDQLAGLSKQADMAYFFDDLNRADYPAGHIINPSCTDSSAYQGRPSEKLLIGPQYAILRPEFRSFALQRRESEREKLDSVLITVGGSDAFGFTTEIMDYLSDRELKLSRRILVGPAFRDIEEIRKRIRDRDQVIVRPEPKALISAMIEADLCIASAGQTALELACCGTPMILLQTAKNQSSNLNLLVERKAAMFGGASESGSLQLSPYLSDSLRLCEKKQTRSQMSVAGKDTVDGLGAVRVAQHIAKRLIEVGHGE